MSFAFRFLLTSPAPHHYRRTFWISLFAALAFTIGSLAASPAQPSASAYRNCITDIQPWYYAPDAEIRRRFDSYKKIGANVLRIEYSWRDIETAEGRWNEKSRLFNYITIAREYGFRVKLIMGVMMSPPQWYLNKYPESRLRDEDGRTSENMMSIWYPGLKRLIVEKTIKMKEILKRKGLWDSIESIIPSYGAAGEPIYPPLWTLGPGFPRQTFWGYDANAQRSFRAYAKNKYASLSNANTAWNTAFASWNDVVVLKPKIKPGRYWEDMLTWYRDSKREYIAWQTQQTLDLIRGDNKKVIIYVPGTEWTKRGWDDAVAAAHGNENIQIMADSKYLIDLAAEKNCMLQYTGMPNAREVKKLRNYMDIKKYKVEMWGENAGMPEHAGDPVGLARIVIENKLFGLDYTHGHFLFKDNGFEPGKNMAQLKTAFEMIGR
jgi:hypothetical protein